MENTDQNKDKSSDYIKDLLSTGLGEYSYDYADAAAWRQSNFYKVITIFYAIIITLLFILAFKNRELIDNNVIFYIAIFITIILFIIRRKIMIRVLNKIPENILQDEVAKKNRQLDNKFNKFANIELSNSKTIYKTIAVIFLLIVVISVSLLIKYRVF